MGSKTVVMNPKPAESEEISPRKPTATLGIQSDTAFSEAAKRLCGRDLCSIADLTVQEMAAIMELAHAVKSQPRRLPPRARRPPDGDVLREGIAAHAPHLRGRHQHARRQRHLRRPDAVAARRARIARRHGAQPRALDEHHRAPHLLARDHHRDGRLLARSPSSTRSPTSSIPARPSPTSSRSKSASARRRAFASPTSATATTSATR